MAPFASLGAAGNIAVAACDFSESSRTKAVKAAKAVTPALPPLPAFFRRPGKSRGAGSGEIWPLPSNMQFLY
jgi:hypothetical protein